MASTPTSAASEGPEWSARATAWTEQWTQLAAPAREAVAEATALGPGMRVLDVGCGSGQFCRLAAERGAEVSGVDAAEGMIEIARTLAPEADLRVGAMESLPWPDAGFDLVTAFNSLQFAADIASALREARRVTRPGGHVVICNWGRPEERELHGVFSALHDLGPPDPPDPGPPAPATGDPGVLERLARAAGMQPQRAGEVDVPFAVPDLTGLERALLVGGGFHTAVEHSGEQAAREAIAETAAPFRRADGSYRFENRFRYLVARA